MKKSQRRKQVWKKTHGVCAHCGIHAPPKLQTIDHFIPLSAGGTYDRRNLVPLCRDCNEARKAIKINPYRYYKYAPVWVVNSCWAYYHDWRDRNRAMDGYIHATPAMREFLNRKVGE